MKVPVTDCLNVGLNGCTSCLTELKFVAYNCYQKVSVGNVGKVRTRINPNTYTFNVFHIKPGLKASSLFFLMISTVLSARKIQKGEYFFPALLLLLKATSREGKVNSSFSFLLSLEDCIELKDNMQNEEKLKVFF